MTNTIRYPLRNISPETFQELQEKYPNASVSIELSDQPAEGGMSDDDFWNLIDLLDWSQTGDDEAVIHPVTSALAARPLRHIYDFKDWLSRKLYLLDGEVYARHTGTYAYGQEPDQFNPDLFLFARCAVVANGRTVYEDVLQHPEKMPKDLDFEPLLRIANEAHQMQRGTVLRYVASCGVETFSNKKGWGETICYFEKNERNLLVNKFSQR